MAEAVSWAEATMERCVPTADSVMAETTPCTDSPRTRCVPRALSAMAELVPRSDAPIICFVLKKYRSTGARARARSSGTASRTLAEELTTALVVPVKAACDRLQMGLVKADTSV
jgi:hypothetical protein